MDAIDTLIDEYKAEQTGKLVNIGISRKPKIISALEDFAEDQRVSEFFLSVASNEQEYDLARIEVLKIFEIMNFANVSVRKRAADIIQNILSQCSDEAVQNYAAMAAANYMEYDGVVSEIDGILLDAQRPSDLRWNAFAAIKTVGFSQRSADLFRTLLSDDEFKQSARRVLVEWVA